MAPRKKSKAEKLSNLVAVLINDRDMVRLDKYTNDRSAYIRRALERQLDLDDGTKFAQKWRAYADDCAKYIIEREPQYTPAEEEREILLSSTTIMGDLRECQPENLLYDPYHEIEEHIRQRLSDMRALKARLS